MAELPIEIDTGRRPVAWLLGAPGMGDNRQLEQLARLLDVEARWIGQFDSVGRVLRDRLLDFRARSIPADKLDLYQPPWPDLVLTIGGRSVIDARRIQKASAGHSRIVCLGRPWAPLNWFDLVVTTPQYRLPEVENVIVIDLPLNRLGHLPESEWSHWQERFSELPAPRVGVLLGGHSGSYRFGHGDALRLVQALDARLRALGGSAVVVASPRTPPEVAACIRERLHAPVMHFDWDPEQPNPMQALLRLADALVVTSDSASMIAEACDSGQPVAVFALSERRRARLIRRLRRVTMFLQPALRNLTRRGCWFPARDMPRLLDRAERSGRIVTLERLSTQPKAGQDSRRADQAIVARVRELLCDRAE